MPIKIPRGKKIESVVMFDEGRPRFVPTQSLNQRGAKSILNYEIQRVSFSMETFTGKEETGYLGLLLKKPGKWKGDEWLVLTVYGAASFCLLDDRWIKADYQFYEIQKPLVSDIPCPDRWDEFRPAVMDCRIDSVELGKDSCCLKLIKIGEKHTLEILNQDPRLPPQTLPSGTPVLCPPGDEVGDYLIFQPDGCYTQW